MMVLHLIDGGCRGGEALRQAELERDIQGCLAVRADGHRLQSVVLVGPRSASRQAEQLGLRIDASISPPLGHTAGVWLQLRRLVDAWGRPQIVTCWGTASARLAQRAWGDSIRRIAMVPEGEASPACDRLVVYGACAKQRLVGQGADESKVTVVPPPMAARRADQGVRLQVRRDLGCNPESVIVVCVGPPGRTDAVRFSFVMGLLAVAGVPVVGVVGADAANSLRASRLSAAEPKLRVVQSNRPDFELLAAADLGLFDGGGKGTAACEMPSPWAAPEPILKAHAAGVPVVAPTWANEDHLFPAEIAAHLLGHNSTLPELARKVAALAADRGALRACSDAVHRDAQDRRERGTFASRIAELWDELMDEPVGVEASV